MNVNDQLTLTLWIDFFLEISYRLDRASLVERERHRYYLLKYMEQRKGDEFEVIVLQRFPRFYLAQIESLGCNTVLHTPSGVSLNPYDRAVAKVEKVSPREDRLTFSLGPRFCPVFNPGTTIPMISVGCCLVKSSQSYINRPRHI